MTTAQNAIQRKPAAFARREPHPLDRRWWGLGFVLPVVLFFATFSVFPVFFGFYLSLTDYDLLNPPLGG